MLERAELTRMMDDALESFIAHPPADAHRHIIRPTSGTSGSGPLLSVIPYAAYLQNTARVTGAERILVCCGSNAIRFLYSVLTAQASPKSTVLTLDRDDLDVSRSTLLKEYAPDRIIGFPAFIARAAELFDRETAAGVRSIRYSGEPLTPLYAELFAATFPNAGLSGCYIGELGPLSKETCAFQQPNRYHPAEGVRVAIHEPDTAGVGEVLVSTTLYGGTPVEQYRTGDMGRIHAGQCKCGEPTTFELLGRRGHDYIKLGGALLIRAEFDRVASLFPEIADYRADASMIPVDGALKGSVVLHVYAPSRPTDARQREVAERFARELFVTHERTFDELVAADALKPLVVTWEDEPFPKENKEVRLRNI